MDNTQLGKRKRSESFKQREGLRKDAKLRSSPLQCPICEVTLRPETLAQHYDQELAKLQQLQPHSSHRKRESHPSTASSTTTTAEGSEGEKSILEHAKEILQSVQRRRFLFEKRSHDQPASVPRSHAQGSSGMCPVCSIQLPSDGSGAAHVDACLEEQQRRTAGEVQSSDGETSGSETYEEYTWCNMTRIRTTSLLSPRTRASMFNAAVISRPSEGDNSFEETVDVEEDTSALYGPPQFCEDDILTVSQSEEATAEDSKQVQDEVGTAPSTEKKSPPQCLICMDGYESPLVSVLCWHVYCERCWLKALSAQKLCPKCKTITCSGDLRRIFL